MTVGQIILSESLAGNWKEMNDSMTNSTHPSRRKFLAAGLSGAAAIASVEQRVRKISLSS